jgi:stage V sporulation protein R
MTLATPSAKRRKPVKVNAPLFEGAEWNYDLLRKVFDAIEAIGIGEMGLNVYPNQIEVITAEQMLDAYASIGMPQMYRHWSFGKHFAREDAMYRRGHRALAYEIVINSDPCISYIMEENSMTMQTLVLAHAAFGHNHFFKNNYLFKQWTDAGAILDYLAFAKTFVTECEEHYGMEAVEAVLDSAHALMQQGISRHPGKRRVRSLVQERERLAARHAYEESTFSDLWRTVPKSTPDPEAKKPSGGSGPLEIAALGLPEENLLYFLEKHAPKLADWQRELLRIVRMLAQYFYPQRQTKLMNEGCATFTHYEILNRMHDLGQLTEGSMLEFMHSHSSVVAQPRFDQPNYNGLNPYALGYAMMRDIKRIAEEPTSEDRDWFPDFAGSGDALGALKHAWAEFRDDSFVMQYLSPKVMRDFRLFEVSDSSSAPAVLVRSIHDEQGYKRVRRTLASHYDVSSHDPDLQVTDADLSGARRLVVTHNVRHGVLLDKEQADRALQHLASLWGYRVKLVEVDIENGKTLKEHEALPVP